MGSPVATDAGNVSRGEGVMVVNVNSELKSWQCCLLKMWSYITTRCLSFPNCKMRINHSIYCIRDVVRLKQVNASKLWVSCLGRSERSARVSCSYEPSKSQGPSVAGRQEKEGELPFPTNSMHLCIVHILYHMHPLSKFFLEANRVPC